MYLLLTILISVTVIGISSLILSQKLKTKESKNAPTFKIIGIIFLVLVGVYGWGIIGSVIPVKSVTESVNPSEVMIGQNNIVVIIDGESYIINTVEDYNNIKNNAVTWYFKRNKCLYNITIDKHLNYQIVQDTLPIK